MLAIGCAAAFAQTAFEETENPSSAQYTTPTTPTTTTNTSTSTVTVTVTTSTNPPAKPPTGTTTGEDDDGDMNGSGDTEPDEDAGGGLPTGDVKQAGVGDVQEADAGGLPFTGLDLGTLVLLALALVGAGAALRAFTRKRAGSASV